MRDVIRDMALLTGRVLNAATDKPLDGTFTIRINLGDLPVRTLPDGTFVFFGRPEVWFAQLGGKDYHLRLRVESRAAEFREGKAYLEVEVTIPQGTTFPQPFSVGDLLMTPDPVNIRGQVVSAREPKTPIPSATVTVTSDWGVRSAVSGVDGRYLLDDLAVGPSAKIQASASGFRTQERTLSVNYRERINAENFRLAGPRA